MDCETIRLRRGLEHIIDASKRIEGLERSDQYRDGYQAAWRDARLMITRVLWPVHQEVRHEQTIHRAAR
jgi:hypothetical protein